MTEPTQALIDAARKMVLVFPEFMPEEPTTFNIPAYIVNELREATREMEETMSNETLAKDAAEMIDIDEIRNSSKFYSYAKTTIASTYAPRLNKLETALRECRDWVKNHRHCACMTKDERGNVCVTCTSCKLIASADAVLGEEQTG